MIEQLKDWMIVIVSAVAAISMYLLNRQKKKLAHAYYENKAIKYKQRAHDLAKKHNGRISDAEKDYNDYKLLLDKYRSNRSKYRRHE